jgi:histidine triad (HIT) family protein
MPLTKEQADQVKKQLLQQLKHFPEDKQEQIKQQILSMNEQQIEQFLAQNQLMTQQQNQASQQQAPPQGQQCIFCSIIEGKIPSYKIDENKNNIAILEINPLSKGHSLIIPKIHTTQEKIPSNSFTLAKKIAKKIKSKFKPKEVKISSAEIFGHGVVEVLPLYGDEKQPKKAPESELQKLQKQLEKKSRAKSTTTRKRKPKSLPQLKPRIP